MDPPVQSATSAHVASRGVPWKDVRIALLAFAILAVAVHLLTLTISPPIWQDEVQIVDWGRIYVENTSRDWSISWIANQWAPSPLVFGLGAVPQELAWRAIGLAGPRICSLIFALLAAWMFLRWLVSRGVTTGLAALASLTLFLDPLFVQSYRGARVDALGIAICLGAAITLRKAGRDLGGSASWRYALAGALSIIAVFAWPSCALALAIVAVEALEQVFPVAVATPRSWRRLSRGLWLIPGAFLALSCCLAVVWATQGDLLGHPVEYLNSLFSAHLAPGVQGHEAVPTVLLRVLRHSPLLWLGVIIGFMLPGHRAVKFCLVLGAAFMASTVIYSFRVLQIVPCAMMLVVSVVSNGHGKIAVSRWFRYLLMSVALWNAALGLVARPYVALSQRHERSPDVLVKAADALGLPSGARVYLATWSLYYEARSRGWRVFREYGPHDEGDLTRLFCGVDYAIFGNLVPPQYLTPLANAGLRPGPKVLTSPVGTQSDLHASGFGGFLLLQRDESRGGSGCRDGHSAPAGTSQ